MVDIAEFKKCMYDKSYFQKKYLSDVEECASNIIYTLLFEKYKVILILYNENPLKEIYNILEGLDFPFKPRTEKNNKRELLFDNGNQILFGLDQARGRGISYVYIEEDYKRVDEFKESYSPVVVGGSGIIIWK